VSVNSISSMAQSLEEDLAMWRDLGIEHVGLILHKVEAVGWDRATELIRDAAVRVSTIAGPVPVPLDVDARSEPRVAERAVIARAIEFAADVGAESVYLCSGSSGALSWEEAAEEFTAGVEPAVRQAAERGIRLAVEPTNPLRADVSFVFTFRDALDLARDSGIDVVADFQSCWYERGFLELLRLNLDRVVLVQVSDYVRGSCCTPDRAVPGDGDVPVEALLAATLAAGYTGPFDLELIGPRIEDEGYRTAIARGVQAVSEMLERLGA
jgi:sugar phosphate isomerase/epimerase